MYPDFFKMPLFICKKECHRRCDNNTSYSYPVSNSHILNLCEIVESKNDKVKIMSTVGSFMMFRLIYIFRKKPTLAGRL